MSPLLKAFPRAPFQFTARAAWQDGELQTDVSFTIATGKRLVIENISASLECPINQDVTSTQVRTVVNGVVSWHSIHVPRTGTFQNSLNLYCGGQAVRLYADPGTTVNVLVHRNVGQCPANCGTTLVCLSGYLINAASPSLAP